MHISPKEIVVSDLTDKEEIEALKKAAKEQIDELKSFVDELYWRKRALERAELEADVWATLKERHVENAPEVKSAMSKIKDLRDKDLEDIKRSFNPAWNVRTNQKDPGKGPLIVTAWARLDRLSSYERRLSCCTVADAILGEGKPDWFNNVWCIKIDAQGIHFLKGHTTVGGPMPEEIVRFMPQGPSGFWHRDSDRYLDLSGAIVSHYVGAEVAMDLGAEKKRRFGGYNYKGEVDPLRHFDPEFDSITLFRGSIDFDGNSKWWVHKEGPDAPNDEVSELFRAKS